MHKAKFCLVCDGKNTYVELYGKSMGKGVKSVSFEHTPRNGIRVNLEIDVNSFEFMPDGYFDEAFEKLRKDPLESI